MADLLHHGSQKQSSGHRWLGYPGLVKTVSDHRVGSFLTWVYPPQGLQPRNALWERRARDVIRHQPDCLLNIAQLQPCPLLHCLRNGQADTEAPCQITEETLTSLSQLFNNSSSCLSVESRGITSGPKPVSLKTLE